MVGLIKSKFEGRIVRHLAFFTFFLLYFLTLFLHFNFHLNNNEQRQDSSVIIRLQETQAPLWIIELQG